MRQRKRKNARERRMNCCEQDQVRKKRTKGKENELNEKELL